MAPVITAIRRAIRTTLIGDGVLTGMLGGPRVYHRNVRKVVEIPSVTYLDYTAHTEWIMPRISTRIQFDVWDRILDDSEEKAERIVQLLDLHASVTAGLPPFEVTTGEVAITSFKFIQDFDNLAPESDDISRKTLMFVLLGFALV